MESSELWKLALFALCMILSGFFSSAETAFIALPRAQLMQLVNSGNSRARLALHLVQRPERLLATVLLSNNLVNTAAAALGTVIAISLIQNSTLALLASTLTVTFLLLVFSEVLPKTVAWKRSEQVSLAFARPLALVQWVLFPAIQILHGITLAFTKVVGIDTQMARSSEQEIKTLIRVGVQAGEVEPSEATLLERVFRFGDQQVTEIMTPRPEIVWVQEGTTLNQFFQIYSGHRHTRFPVFQDSIENVTGVISIKDLFLALAQGNLGLDDSVTSLARPAMFVPETKPVRETFAEMQPGRQGLVLAVDEFGGIAGMATLEQLLEVIVGDVADEGDAAEQTYVAVSDTVFRLKASVGIAEINDELDLQLPEGQYKTVAGFILETLGRVPVEGDTVHFQDLTLTVRTMDGVRIDEVDVERIE